MFYGRRTTASLAAFPLVRLRIPKRESARPLVHAGAFAPPPLVAGKHDTPEPKGGQGGTARHAERKARLAAGVEPQVAVKGRSGMVLCGCVLTTVMLLACHLSLPPVRPSSCAVEWISLTSVDTSTTASAKGEMEPSGPVFGQHGLVSVHTM